MALILTKWSSRSLERSLEVSSGRLAPDPDESMLGFQSILDGQDGLDDEAVRWVRGE